MKKILNLRTYRILAIALILILSILSFTSCRGSVADKETIYSRMENTPSDSAAYNYVVDYLNGWGIRNINVHKFQWAESAYHHYYAYGDGLPKAVVHAKLVATDFLENYYDVIDLTSTTAVTDALLTCYADAVDDPYSIYRAPEAYDEYYQDLSGSFGGIGVNVLQDSLTETITVTGVIEGSPAALAGILPGDVLYAVDGKTVEEIGFDYALDKIRGSIGTSVTVVMKRGEELLSFKMTREAISEKSVGYAIDPETNIAYIRIASFKSNTADQFIEAVDAAEQAGVRGIIFDVRFNPGGYVNVVKKMLSYLVPTGEILASYRYSGQVVVVDKAYDDVHPTKKDENGADLVEDHVISVPVVVICDEYTASSGELFTAAIRDYRDMGLIDATIVGATTYKKGIMQNTYTYSFDRSSITFTVAYYDPPCGENYHGIGVIPDVEVPSSYTEDLQYPRALEELEKLINSKEQ